MSLKNIPAGHFPLQLVSSFSTVVNADENSEGHEEQELAAINVSSFRKGEDMNELTGQHPYLAVLDPRLPDVLHWLFRVFHWLPHNVRLNPLFINTTNPQEKKVKYFNLKKNCCCEGNK